MSVLIVCIAFVLLVVSGKFRQALYARFVFEIIALMCLCYIVHRFSDHLRTTSLSILRHQGTNDTTPLATGAYHDYGTTLVYYSLCVHGLHEGKRLLPISCTAAMLGECCCFLGYFSG